MIRNFFIVLLILFPLIVFAQTKEDIIKAFRSYGNVSPNVSVPTVVEVPFKEGSFSIPVFAVYNLTTSEFEPYLLSIDNLETKSRIEASGAVGDTSTVNDNDYSTYLEFPLNSDLGKAEIVFNFDKPIVASSLLFTLDNYVALPEKISINAIVDGKDYTVLAPVKPFQNNIVFPKTTSSVWRVVFDYVQPLRISEIKFNDISVNQITKRGLRFLAQPGQNYQVYFDADRYVQSTKKETGDLFSNNGVVNLGTLDSISNIEYKPADSDSDGVPDLSDNCVNIINSDQKDGDGNGRGDECEDYDRDGILNAKDNCLEIPNVAQSDVDNDGIGDVCDDKENRTTERMPWLPWVGIAFAGLVILVLFMMVFKYKKEDNY